MKWYLNLIAMTAVVCCFVMSADAGQRIVTKTKQVGIASIANVQPMSAVQESPPQPQLSAPTYVRDQVSTPTQQANMTFERARGRSYYYSGPNAPQYGVGMPTPTQQANTYFERSRTRSYGVSNPNPGPPGFHFGR